MAMMDVYRLLNSLYNPCLISLIKYVVLSQ